MSTDLVRTGPDGLDDLHTDDAAYQVDAHFLGVPGYPSIPTPPIYPAIGTGFVLFWVVTWFLRRLGMHPSVGFALVDALLTILVTKRVMKLSSYDRPVRYLPVTFWHEVSGPRKPKPVVYTLDATKVKVKR